jgi:Fe-S-cluster containining protein
MAKPNTKKVLKKSIKSDPEQWSEHLIEPATLEAFFQDCVGILSEDQGADKLRGMADAVIGDLEEIWTAIKPEQPDYACRKGCSWCCHQNVTVTLPELHHILAYLKSEFDQTKLLSLKNKFREQAEKIAGKTTNERFDERTACGFLENDACSIHPARPLQCRGGFSEDEQYCRSLLEDREATQNGVKDGTEQGKYLLAPKLIYNSAQLAMSSALRDAGLDGDAYELTVAMALLLESFEPDQPGALAPALLQKVGTDYATPRSDNNQK